VSLISCRSRRRADGTRTVIVKVAGTEVFRGVQLALPIGGDLTQRRRRRRSRRSPGRNPTADQLPLA
jgi:hypothetical protein